MGHNSGPIGRVEQEALWELAHLSKQDEHARVLFLQRALKEPGTAEQLANRLEPAVHAAIGLSPEWVAGGPRQGCAPRAVPAGHGPAIHWGQRPCRDRTGSR